MSRPPFPRRPGSYARAVQQDPPQEELTPGATHPADVAELSRYIADICAELTAMASSARLVMLTYLLGMAYQEAGRLAQEAGKAD